MPTRAAEQAPSNPAQAAKSAATHAGAIARLELRRALVEVKAKLAQIGTGAGLAAGAGLLALYMLLFVLGAAAAGIATTLPVWSALLIVAGLLLVIIAVLALLARRALRCGLPPAPEAAIEEARLTAQALTENGNRRAP
jgi:hypothetical protein